MTDTLTLDHARRWVAMPKMAPEVEKRAALGAIAFLRDVAERLEGALADIAAGRAPADGSELHAVWDFSAFAPETIDFLIALLGEGEVRITLCRGEAKTADTVVPGLWRVQTGRDGESNSFVLARIPRAVEHFAEQGLERVPRLVNPDRDVFAATAILAELNELLESADLTTIPASTAPMVELSRQPLTPSDLTALYSTLGTGEVEAALLGFARSTITSTTVRNIWHSRIVNNAGKNLLEAYVVAKLPPELPVAVEEFADGAARCRELVEWLEADIERGAIGEAVDGKANEKEKLPQEAAQA